MQFFRVKIIILFLVLTAQAVQAGQAVKPYVFNIYFGAYSATPEMDILIRLAEIKEAIKEKKPVKIELEAYVDLNEEKGLAKKRAGYVKRWLSSEKINAVYSITLKDDSEQRPCDRINQGNPENRRVKIIVYDQRIIYAIQDAKRAAREKAKKRPLAHTSMTVHSFGSLLEGTPVAWTFDIRNIGDAPLEIVKVKPD